MASGGQVVITLKRYDTSQPWGFKMQGGSDVGMPLHIAQVSPGGLASQHGMRQGDALLKIGNTVVEGFKHEEARGEMIRSGNDVKLTLQRGAVGNVQSHPEPEARASVSDSVDTDVKPKTYQILDKELPQAAATGTRPASIFDRKRQERSAYTQAAGSGYTKAYGQPKQ